MAVALTKVRPTAGSNAASQRWARKLAAAAVSAKSAKRVALRSSSPKARRVRTPESVSCTWSLSLPKASSESREASWIWLEMRQNAHAMKGNGSKAAKASRPSTPMPIMAITKIKVKVPSNPASIASPEAISTESMSLVASAIKSPVRFCWKKCGPCWHKRAYKRWRNCAPRR